MDRLALLRAAVRRKAPTPIGALMRGLAAGAVGAGVQSLFLRATGKWAPEATAAPRSAPPAFYGSGVACGGLYGLATESMRLSPLAFGTFVWATNDALILPRLGLAASPRHLSLRAHAHALSARLVYALATAGAYAVLRDVGAVPLTAIPAVAGLQAMAWLRRAPPARMLRKPEPWPRRVFHGTLMQKAALA